MIKQSIFHLKQLLGNRAALRLHEELKREECLSVDELEALAWRRRQALVEHAWRQVPFYQRKYREAGFQPGDLRRPEDFQLLPVLSKEELRASFADLISTDSRPGQRRLSVTGGSTGEPVRVLFDRRVPLEAFAWRALAWWGVNPADDVAFVFRRTRQGLALAANNTLWWPTRRLFLDAAAMTPQRTRAFIAQLRRVRPVLLQGYMGALADVAQHLEDAGDSLDFVQAVWSTSAPLPPALRLRMQQAFGAPVYDQYGCGEVFWLACECRRQTGLHIFHSRRQVEFADAAGRELAAGEMGDILITDLANRVFPLIRYRNGDRGRRLSGACACGISLPRMDGVKGRISDALRLPGGLTLSGDFLTTIFDSCPEAVKAFQLRQARDGSLTLRCVPGQISTAKTRIDEVAQALRTRLEGRTTLRLELVEHIGHDQGKTRFIISELAEKS